MCQYYIQTAEPIQFVFGKKVSAYPTLFVKEIQISPKIRLPPSVKFSQILNSEKICHGTSTVVECHNARTSLV